MIRDNYEIEEHEEEELAKAKEFEKLGLMNLQEEIYVKCVSKDCKNKIGLTQRNIFEVECPSCQTVFHPKRTSYSIKQKLNEEGIFSYIIGKLDRYKPQRNVNENVIEIEFDGKKGKVVLLDYCLNTFLFEPKTDDFLLRIVVDAVKTRALKGTEQHKFCTLEQVVEKEVNLEKAIESLFAETKISISLEDIAHYNKFIENLDKAGKKLENFVESLTNYIQANRKIVNKFMLSLEKDKGTIWGAKVVKLTGPSQTDLVQIPLYSYLEELLKSNKNYECKSWIGSHLKPDSFGSSFVHAQQLGKKGINLIVIAQKISPEVWSTAIASMNQSFKIILIDKYILLRILDGIDGFKLLPK